MKTLLARYLADFNRREWWDQEPPGPWSTLAVTVVVMAAVVIVWTYLQ